MGNHRSIGSRESRDRRRAVGARERLDEKSIEAVAQRVVELLTGDGWGEGLVDAAAVARRYGLSRSTVYERAEELGAVRIGDGPRARLRFDPGTVEVRLLADGPEQPREVEASRTRHRGARTPGEGRDDSELLPIRGRAMRGGGR